MDVKPSPWSTPRKSEYGEGFIEIKDEDEEDAYLLAELMVREMGDGESAPNCDDETAQDLGRLSQNNNNNNNNNNIDSVSKVMRSKKEKVAKKPVTLKKTENGFLPNKQQQQQQQQQRLNHALNRSQSLRNKQQQAGEGGAKSKVIHSRGSLALIDAATIEEGKKKEEELKRRQNSEAFINKYNRVSKKWIEKSRKTRSPSPTAPPPPPPKSVTPPPPKPPPPPKSPQKRKSTAVKPRDVIELKRPYNILKSDDVKKWEREISATGKIDESNESNELMTQLAFSNGLIIKLLQLSKQGLLDKHQIFTFACYISHYDITESDRKKCVTSFFGYARQLARIRNGIETPEQKERFDLEAASWAPPMYVNKKASRPGTSKPREPDEYEFADEEIARDYRKLWEQYQELQSLQNKKEDQHLAPHHHHHFQLKGTNNNSSNNSDRRSKEKEKENDLVQGKQKLAAQNTNEKSPKKLQNSRKGTNIRKDRIT